MDILVPHDAFQAEAFLRDVLGARNSKPNAQGDELIHSCILPFGLHRHGDASPAASLNVDKLLYNCFVCGGGTLLWATQSILGVSSADARRLITKNLSPVNQSKESVLQNLERAWKEDQEQAMPKYSLKLVERWMTPLAYLDKRGITREVQTTFRTGVNKENMDPITMKDGTELMLNQPRLVLPHLFRGVLRGWSSRKLAPQQVGAKYRHTPSFPANVTLFNYDAVFGKVDWVIVVESPMSVLKLASYGYHNAVATFGAEVGDDQVRLLARFKKVVLFPDGDRAGYRSMRVLNRRRQDDGVIVRLMPKTNLFVCDHGYDPETEEFNEMDPADYTAEEVGMILEDMQPAMLWQWEDKYGDKGGLRRMR